MIPYHDGSSQLVLDTDGPYLIILDPRTGKQVKERLVDDGVAVVVDVTPDLSVVRLLSGRDRDDLTLLAFPLGQTTGPVGQLDVSRRGIEWRGEDRAWNAFPRVAEHPAERGVLLVLKQEPGSVEAITLPSEVAGEDKEWGLLTIFLPESKWVAIATYRVGSSVAIMDLGEGRLVHTIPIPHSIQWVPRVPTVDQQAWLPCGPLLVRLDFEELSTDGVVDVGGWRDDSVVDIALDDRTHTVVAGLHTSGAVLVLDTRSMQVTHRVETREALGAVALLDDERLLTRSFDGREYSVHHLRGEQFRLPE